MDKKAELQKHAEVINRSFLDVVGSNDQEALDKWAAEADNYLRLVRREKGFARKFLPPQTVTENDLIPALESDELFYRAEKQPYSGPAVSISWRGEPEAQYLEGERYDILMNPIVSPLFEKKSRELRAYRMPFTRLIEKQAALDIEFAEDELFIGLATAAATASGQVISVAPGSDPTAEILSQFFNTFPQNSEYTVDSLLMSDLSYNNWTKQATVLDSGGGLWDKVHEDGWTSDKILGKRTVYSTKTHLIDEYDNAGNLVATRIFAFISPDMLGNFLMLQDLKMYLENKRGSICFHLEEIIGMVIENIYGVAILRLPV